MKPVSNTARLPSINDFVAGIRRNNPTACVLDILTLNSRANNDTDINTIHAKTSLDKLQQYFEIYASDVIYESCESFESCDSCFDFSTILTLSKRK